MLTIAPTFTVTNVLFYTPYTQTLHLPVALFALLFAFCYSMLLLRQAEQEAHATRTKIASIVTRGIVRQAMAGATAPAMHAAEVLRVKAAEAAEWEKGQLFAETESEVRSRAIRTSSTDVCFRVQSSYPP